MFVLIKFQKAKHEIEHIRGLQRVCLEEMRIGTKVMVSTVMAKALKHMQVADDAGDHRSLIALTKFVTDLGAGHMVDELCEFHSQEVNPATLTVSHTLFDEVVKQLGANKFPILKVCLLTLAYNPVGSIPKVRPNPNVADFIKTADIRTLGGGPKTCEQLETWLRTIRITHEPVLKSWLPPIRARQIVRELEQAGLRVALGKATTSTFKEAGKVTKLTKAEYSDVRMGSIETAWKRWVEATEKPPDNSPWEYHPAVEEANQDM